ncbi:MAG: YfhO family protein [Flavobacteriales bacterium]
MKFKIPENIAVPLWLFVLSFLVFGQVGLMQQPLRWDAIDCFLPWRLNVAEALRMGEMPYWSAFQHLGFPLHAEADTGAFYPILWLISLVYGYDYYALNFEWCLHVFIGAWGTWRLIASLGYSKTAAWVCAFGFLGSGVFTSNAQNFGFLIGYAWFPWVFMYFRLALSNGHWKYILGASFSTFMMFTGSYPPIVVIGGYVVVAYGIYFIVKNRKDTAIYSRIVWIGLAVLLSCALPLMAMVESFGDVTRTQGLEARKILENPFPIKAYTSVFTPFAVGTPENYSWGSDFSMVNFYFGLGALLGVFAWFFSKVKRTREYFALLTFVVLMLVAAGEALPFRMWLAKFPAMDMFRHPSIFRFIAINFILIVAAAGIEAFFDSKSARKWSIISLAIVFTLVIGFNLSGWTGEALVKTFSEMFSWQRTVSISVASRIAIQSALQLIFIILFFVFSLNKRAFITLSALNILMAVQLNVQSTVVYPEFLARENKKLETLIQNRIPYHGEEVSPYCMDSTNTGMAVVWRNENIYLRQPGWDGYNSYIFSVYRDAEDSGKLLEYIKHPLIFTADSSANSQFSEWQVNTNSISAKVQLQQNEDVVLLQSYQKNWICEVDGQKVEISRYDGTFPMVEVGAGEHQVEFRYAPKNLLIAMLISLFSLGMLTYLGFFRKKVL